MNGEEKISYLIETIAQKLNIPYISNNPHYNEYKKDALKLYNIYRTLKEIASELLYIEEKYNISNLKELLDDDIRIIEKIDHDIIKIAKSLCQKNEK